MESYNEVSVNKTSLLRFIYLISGIGLLIFISTVNLSMTTTIELLLVFYAWTALIMLKIFGTFRRLVLSIEFVLITAFLLYAVIGPITFVWDGFKPRTYAFSITRVDMLITLQLYFKILIQTALWLVLFFVRSEKQGFAVITSRVSLTIRHSIFADILAVGCVIFFSFLFLKSGFSVFDLYIRDIRTQVDTPVNQYIYVFMVVYSYVFLQEFIVHRMVQSITILRIGMIALFWFFSLFVDRRYFVLLMLMVAYTVICNAKKIRIRSIFIILMILVVLLLTSMLREGFSLGSLSMNDSFYYSTTEFTLTNYVSVFYSARAGTIYPLMHGLTYTWYVFAYLFPSVIFPWKPESLGTVFMQQAHTNVGFAFNPVAEGIVNFGMNCVYLVPVLLVLYVWVAKTLGRRNKFIYILFYAYVINLMRGMTAMIVFELVFMVVLFYLFFEKAPQKMNMNHI